MMEPCRQCARFCESRGTPRFAQRPDHPLRKVSGVRDLIDVYTSLAARCSYPLHLGLTEPAWRQGTDRFHRGCAAAASRHRRHHSSEPDPKPGGDRTEEVLRAADPESLGIRSFMPQVTSCPGCGRTTSTYFQELAEQIQSYWPHRCRSGTRSIRRRGTQAGRHGLRGQTDPANRTRNWASPTPPSRSPRPRLRGRQALQDAPRRHDCGRVQADSDRYVETTTAKYLKWNPPYNCILCNFLFPSIALVFS